MTDLIRTADRIKLVAEAMGWVRHGDEFYTQDKTMRSFDPFTDANDDYAVLEWIRAKSDYRERLKYWDAIRGNIQTYRIGDYAKAALKVLEKDSE